MCQTQHQKSTAEKCTLLITTTTHGIHSNAPNRRISLASSKGNRFALTAICILTGFTFCIPLKSKHAEDVINAYINHICCAFRPSKKILTDNSTEFKNKLWTDVFEKLRTEQKFTPFTHHNAVAG